MNLNELFEARRAIRHYREAEPVSAETLKTLIEAAQQGPTWKNSQTGRYYAVTDPAKLAEVVGCLPPMNADHCTNVTAIIVTAFETKVAGHTNGEPDNELGDQWGAYDLGLQNMCLMLKAAELGLDTLIMGIRDGEGLRKVLDIPASQQVVSVIPVGYRVKDPKKPIRKPMEEIAKFF